MLNSSAGLFEMLTLKSGKETRFCDGFTRRNFLKIGALGMGGLGLPQLLEAQAQSGSQSSQKAVIMVYLQGGPPQMDTFDMKEEAPSEIRGEFESIPTKLPGVRICEHLPGIAKILDKCTIIRSVTGMENHHRPFEVMTGRPKDRPQPVGGWPSMGSVISKLKGPYRGTPGFINLGGGAIGGGFLGRSHDPFMPSGKGRQDMAMQKGMQLLRIDDRRNLLKNLDTFRRDCDAKGVMGSLDAFGQQAFDIVFSERLVKALDLKNEDSNVIRRYGTGYLQPTNPFLLARRVVEAGARFVTFEVGSWDTHKDNFPMLRNHRLKELNSGISNLLKDLEERDMLDDVTIIAWGEFGRTPKINNRAGRDHWPRVMSVLMAGGGMKNGQVIGSTDSHAADPNDRPVYIPEIFATLYHNMGIDVSKVQLPDLAGRPQFLVDHGMEPIRELVG